MRSNTVLHVIIGALFINIFILYWLVYSLFVAIGEIPDAQDSPLLVQNVVSKIDRSAPSMPTQSGTQTASASAASAAGELFTDCPACNEEFESLKKSIEAVNNKVEVLEKSSGKQTVVPQKSTTIELKNSVREVTIPFGSGQTDSKEWIDIPGMNAYIDSENYGPVSSIRFEAVIRIPTAVGYVHARLYNVTAKHPVWNSEVQSETDKALLKESDPIVLDGGNNLYQVQMKSTIGHVAIIDSGRIKIYLK